MKRLLNNKITIIAGHYGTGKTNIAVNLALALANEDKKCCIVDLDIVNPYFRSADNKTELQNAGVKVVIPEFANTNVEILSLPQYQFIFNSDYNSVIDVGGDSDGAIALAIHQEDYIKAGYSMYFVYNFYRPSIADPQKAFELLKHIEKTSNLKFCGIINNSNLGEDSDDDILNQSFEDADKLSILSALPIVAVTAMYSSKLTNKNLIKIQNKTKRYY